nr:dUTP pyrophosphatase [Pithovirus mammoth]
MEVQRLSPDAKLPTKATPFSAGWDLFISEEAVVEAGTRKLLPTSIAVKIPVGYCGQLWTKSGLASKKSVEIGAGIIDSDYRGEVKVLFLNDSKENISLKKGDPIAQMVIVSICTDPIIEVSSLDSTQRGSMGFGMADEVGY